MKPNQTEFRSTYRLQLQKSFPLKEAAKVSGYLDELGISHLYLSPIFEAREGSNHGYDSIDPTKISEERGGDAGFEELLERVEKAKNIEGVILDIVPNHVAASSKNPAWWDMLKNGQESQYWTCFDVRPRAGGRDMRVVLPVLGRSRQSVLAARELQVALYQSEFVIRYYDNVFPISEKSYPRIIRAVCGDWGDTLATAGKWKKELLSIASKKNVSTQFTKWLKASASASRALELSLKVLPLKFVETTLDEQNYSLEEWKSGSRDVNYRRFFDINDLAAVRVEDEMVFKWSHSKVRELTKKYPLIHGLRVDHVDGLTYPEEYLKRLKGISKNIWVEKILGENEKIPSSWPVQGTTGYEFSNATSRLFVSLTGSLYLHAHYTRHIDRRWERFHECVYDSKREMLESHFVSELNYLSDQLFQLASRGKKMQFTRDEMHEALKELTSSLRVYRTYFGEGNTDTRYLEAAFKEVEGRGRLHSKPAMNWLRSVLLGNGDWSEPTFKTIKRWEQLTGPVMAKGLEDTALYRYFPLLSLNGVGGEPDWTGDGAIEFHAFNQERLRSEPLSMSATSTHDTKRSEDVRSRIHILSELAEDWCKKFDEWRALNSESSSQSVRIDISTEYMIYETLLGAWPMDGKVDETFLKRMQDYFIKAVREGKSETSWTEPNEPYETALKNFIERILFPKTSKAKSFLKSFTEFQSLCAYFGAMNSLSLLTLKTLSPGIPDFYQGCEIWDLSLVDPDNRRPVDYGLRRKLLKEIKAARKNGIRKYQNEIITRWKTGEVKLYLTYELLKLRKEDPALFTEGEYFAIEPHGEGRSHFVGFYRNLGARWLLVIAPRFLAGAQDIAKKLVVTNETALETSIDLLPQAPRKWKNAFTGEEISGESFTAEDLLDGMPVGVWIAKA